MAWTYDVTKLTDPTDGPLMEVRLHIGDTTSDDPQLQDEEIRYYLATQTNTIVAASRCCSALAAKYAREANRKMGDLALEYEKLSSHYTDLAKTLFDRGTNSVPTAGGIYRSEKQAAASNPALSQPTVRIGMHDFSGSTVVPTTRVGEY